MNDWTFVPTDDDVVTDVPYIEDARSDFAPYWSVLTQSEKKIQDDLERAKREVTAEMAKLGGGIVGFQQGYFNVGKKKRHGYRILFFYGGGRGIIRIAGLPMKGEETKRKTNSVLAQALFNVRDWLKAAVTNRIFSPGFNALVPFMLVDGHRTVTDYLIETGNLPQLNAPGEYEVQGK
jgi:hypothetical protein